MAEAPSTFRAGFHRVVDASLGIIYPPTCPGCDVSIPASRVPLPICGECKTTLHQIHSPYCRVCGQAFEGKISGTDFQCSNCKNRKLGFDFAVAGYQADGLARELMHQFKYERNIHLVKLLGRLMEPALLDERVAAAEKWMLVPVPLHRRRFLDRGFNQAFELCRVLRDRNPKKFAISKKILRRVRHTKRQAGLDREERLSNLKNAFAIQRFFLKRDAWKGKRILLVDDVLTTGATASECARVLKSELDVADVGVLTVLRG